MPELALSSFNHQHPNPPDERERRNTLNDRNVILPSIRWEGMRVYVLETQREYQLRGGITNEYWVDTTGSGGGEGDILLPESSDSVFDL